MMNDRKKEGGLGRRKEEERIEMWSGEERAPGNKGMGPRGHWWEVQRRPKDCGIRLLLTSSPCNMPRSHPELQAQWPSHPSDIHRNKSQRDSHLILRKRYWTETSLGSWVSVPGFQATQSPEKHEVFEQVEADLPAFSPLCNCLHLTRPVLVPQGLPCLVLGALTKGNVAIPGFPQWTNLLRLYGPASSPDFPRRAEEGSSLCVLLPTCLSLVTMTRWYSLSVVNKNPLRKRPLGTEQQQSPGGWDRGRMVTCLFPFPGFWGIWSAQGRRVWTWSPWRNVENFMKVSFWFPSYIPNLCSPNLSIRLCLSHTAIAYWTTCGKSQFSPHSSPAQYLRQVTQPLW